MLPIKLHVSKTEKWEGHPQQYIISEANCFSHVENRCETQTSIPPFVCQSGNSFPPKLIIASLLWRGGGMLKLLLNSL